MNYPLFLHEKGAQYELPVILTWKRGIIWTTRYSDMEKGAQYELPFILTWKRAQYDLPAILTWKKGHKMNYPLYRCVNRNIIQGGPKVGVQDIVYK